MIIFVKTRALYESYFDFWQLVKLSDFTTVFADEVDPASDNVYIIPFMNSECGNGWENPRARIIHYCGEWYHEPLCTGCIEVWHFDRWYADKHGLKYVPMGSHSSLADAPMNGTGNVYDAAYLGYMIPRRQRIQYECGREGVMLSPSSAWGEERHRILVSSKTYLHVHQLEDTPGIPGLRMVVAAAYHLPVIMERVEARGIFEAGDFLECSYDQLAGFVKQWTWQAPEAQLRDIGERLHERLCVENTFRRMVEEAL